MSVLDEVKQKRDYAQSRKDAGEQGYDPAIEFYNRIIVEMTTLQDTLRRACIALKEHEPTLMTRDMVSFIEDTYSRHLPEKGRYETPAEISERVAAVHKSHMSFDPSAR